MVNLVRLLAVLGKINPAVFDAIFPHGPVGPHGLAVRRFSPGAEVALNPQPLPPKEALLVASAEGSRTTSRTPPSALRPPAATVPGGSSRRAIDEWCGTRPRPLPIPWPGPWPFPWPPEPRAAP